MEAEFTPVLNGRPIKVEDLFTDPREFIKGSLVHRVGTSYHVPTGGAVYFDTGVIEVATPLIEIERGCAARAGRSLWDSIKFVRAELDEWERDSGNHVSLTGFSTHYNVSFDHNPQPGTERRTVENFALLLAYILPVPVMLLAANRRSTGIGVRPRPDRIEVTADFTPSSTLLIAAGTLITGIVRDVMTWPSFEVDALEQHGIPVIEGYEPMPHTSRKGWLARYTCFPNNPFAIDIDRAVWPVAGRSPYTLRDIGREIVSSFSIPIAHIADPFSWRTIKSVMTGRAPSLLELIDRPPSYEDVGRLCTWDDLFPSRMLERSRYEEVLIRAISGEKLTIAGETYTPTGVRGWSRVVFRRDSDATRHVIPLDVLLRWWR
jgi:hypothetical protein